MRIPEKRNFRIRNDRSRIHGKGVFAEEPIPARRKVGSLGGILISKKAARKLAGSLQSISIVELWNGKAIDASGEKGLRYINHSCAPNTFMRNRGIHVEFYALRQIDPGEELTCNYGPTHHDGQLKCKCGAPGCKGML